MEDEVNSLAGVAVVEFEEVGQRLALLKGYEGQEDVAGEREIERGVGFAMAVPIFLPGAGVALVVVAVFHRPVLASGTCRLGSFLWSQAGEEEAGVVFLRLKGILLLRPIAPNGEGRAGTQQPGVDGGDGGDGSATSVQTAVFALLAQVKKGVP